tara:strand:- start:974 stop:1159 length:186 start_codon:yes stop_codon:yes gene_type:complete
MLKKQKQEKEKMEHAMKSIKPKLDVIKDWVSEEDKGSFHVDHDKVSINVFLAYIKKCVFSI